MEHEMRSTVTGRWKCASESEAVKLGTHLLDFVNAGLVELTVNHVVIEPERQPVMCSVCGWDVRSHGKDAGHIAVPEVIEHGAPA